MNPFLLAAVHALIALAIQLGLARLLDFVESGTRAQALGACIASVSFLVSGFLLGVRSDRSAAAPTSDASALALPAVEAVPWLGVLLTSAVLAIAGLAGYFTPVFESVVGASSLAHGGVARTIFAADFVTLPALFLVSVGSLLGAGTRRWTVVTGLVGFFGLVGGSVGGYELAQQLTYDVNLVRAYAVAAAVVSALIIGFAISWVRRRMAFVEQVLVALIAGYTIYFIVAVGPKELMAQANLPDEQVLLSLAFAPTIALLIALVVGGSFGFVLHGGGRFDAGFKYEAEIAVRHLKSLRSASHSAISVVAIISVAGVATGVLALIVVLSVMSGFEEDLKSKILGAHAHIVLEKTGDDFYEYEEVEKRVQDLVGVQSAAAYILGDGMISSDAGLSGTLVKGIDPRNARATAELRKNVDKGAFDHLLEPEKIPGARIKWDLDPTQTSTRVDGAAPVLREIPEGQSKVLPGIIIGRELSKTLRAYVGDTVKLVSPVSEDIGPMGPQPKLRRFRVAGIFYSGMYEYDAKFTYVDMKQAQSFFGMRKKVSGVEVKVGDVDDTPRLVEEMKRKVGGYPYKVKDWREMNKELFSALLLEKLAMFIILTFIILVASFNIVATLIMIVLERGKEIAVLKSLGASDASIMKIFVVQGLIVGFSGTLLGLLGGVGICVALDKFQYQLDQKVFYIERLPVVMSWGEIAAIGVAAVVISYLATIYPAITAAQLRPVEGLRDD